MTQREHVLSALSYRRNVGANASQVRKLLELGLAPNPRVSKDDLARVPEVLKELVDDGLIYNVGKDWFFTRSGRKLAAGRKLPAEWQSDDALILLSACILRNKAGIKLDELIAVCDGIDHAIPTHSELHGAINRLLSCKLMTLRSRVLNVSDKAKRLHRKVEANCGRYVLDHLDGLESILKCPCCGVKLNDVRWSFELPKATYDAAVKHYFDRHF